MTNVDWPRVGEDATRTRVVVSRALVRISLVVFAPLAELVVVVVGTNSTVELEDRSVIVD